MFSSQVPPPKSSRPSQNSTISWGTNVWVVILGWILHIQTKPLPSEIPIQITMEGLCASRLLNDLQTNLPAIGLITMGIAPLGQQSPSVIVYSWKLLLKAESGFSTRVAASSYKQPRYLVPSHLGLGESATEGIQQSFFPTPPTDYSLLEKFGQQRDHFQNVLLLSGSSMSQMTHGHSAIKADCLKRFKKQTR